LQYASTYNKNQSHGLYCLAERTTSTSHGKGAFVQRHVDDLQPSLPLLASLAASWSAYTHCPLVYVIDLLGVAHRSCSDNGKNSLAPLVVLQTRDIDQHNVDLYVLIVNIIVTYMRK
jgi:hypothetical protein